MSQQPIRLQHSSCETWICSYRDAAPLAPHPHQDVGRPTGAPAHLTPRRWCQVSLPPVVVKCILEQQKVDPVPHIHTFMSHEHGRSWLDETVDASTQTCVNIWDDADDALYHCKDTGGSKLQQHLLYEEELCLARCLHEPEMNPSTELSSCVYTFFLFYFCIKR